MTCRALQHFYPLLFSFVPPLEWSILPAEGQSVSELGCSIFRTVFLSPLCTADSVSHGKARSPGRAAAKPCSVSSALPGWSASWARVKLRVWSRRCSAAMCPSWRREEFLVWELQSSTEGQKLGAASKINLGMGTRSASGHVLISEHSRRGGLSSAPASSALKQPGCCIETALTFLMEGFPTRKRYFIEFKMGSFGFL